MPDWKTKDEKFWREKLTPEQYKVCRRQGTEKAFSGEHLNKNESGVYKCVCCGLELFASQSKFDSGTGWPSFFEPIKNENIEERPDNSLFRKRTEVLCPRCGAHLGHVFKDGPEPTGLRYCINSVALDFDKERSE